MAKSSLVYWGALSFARGQFVGHGLEIELRRHSNLPWHSRHSGSPGCQGIIARSACANSGIYGPSERVELEREAIFKHHMV